MNRKPYIHFHIEELVLDGFEFSDRQRIGDAVQHELARLFLEQAVPSVLRQDRAIARLDGGSFETAPASRPESTGAQVARTLFGGFSK